MLDDLQQIEVDFETARRLQVPYMATVRLSERSLGTVTMKLPVARFDAVLAPPEVLSAIGEPFGTEPVVTAGAHASPTMAIAPMARTILCLALAVILTVLLLLS